MLRSLAYNACQVPNRYRIDRHLVFNVEPVAFAGGGFSDVYKGTLGNDQLVAVKVLRMATTNDIHQIQKVRFTEPPFFLR